MRTKSIAQIAEDVERIALGVRDIDDTYQQSDGRGVEVLGDMITALSGLAYVAGTLAAKVACQERTIESLNEWRFRVGDK